MITQRESLFPEPGINKHWETNDITANRHQGNANSVAAHEKVAEHKRVMCAKVYEYIVAQRDRGATSKEIVAHFGKDEHGNDRMPLQTVSARMADLLALEMIEETDLPRRNGCGVRKAKCWL